MPRLVVVILLVVNAQLGCAPLARQPKRRRSTPISAALSAVELLTKAAEMLTLRTPAHVYLMDSILVIRSGSFNTYGRVTMHRP